MSMSYSWLEFFVALLAFVVSHAIPAFPALRARLITHLGRRVYFLTYGATSLALLIWLVTAASNTPYVELWPATEHLLWVPRLTMLPAVILAVNGLIAPNPLSLTMNRHYAFDPVKPGIVGIVRHPVLCATLIWSVSHILANGTLAHALLFGSFAVMSVAGMVAIDRRRKARLGLYEWRRLAALGPLLPLLPSLLGGWRPTLSIRTLWPSVLGTAVYVALAAGHVWFAGVPSYP
jgi:uncharacterized membrane protein